jgi:hypothetical protein
MRNKIIQTTIFFFLFSCNCTIKAQENKLFKEYISCFTEKHFTGTFQNCDTIGSKPYVPIKSDYLKFLDNDMQDTTMITWIAYKVDNKHYLTLLSQQIDNALSYYYYFVFYDEIGNIINSYKFIASSEDEYDTKLFLSKDRIKYFLYGPYVEKEKTNCKEVLYEIVNNGSLKQVSEQNYKVERKDLFTW